MRQIHSQREAQVKWTSVRINFPRWSNRTAVHSTQLAVRYLTETLDRSRSLRRERGCLWRMMMARPWMSAGESMEKEESGFEEEFELEEL